MNEINALLLACSSFIGWAWGIFSVEIPVLGIPFWSIPAAAVAVDLSFWILGRLLGGGVSPGPLGSPSSDGRSYNWRGHKFEKR